MTSSDAVLPQQDELVLCTVTAIQYHSVFVTMDEYGGKTGMIHISEIAPGRIRNIRDYVQVGRKVVCKVLRIDMQKGHVDLSLRRVNDAQRRLKLNQIKQEQLAEKIVEFVAKARKQDPAAVLESVVPKLSAKYASLFSAFEEVSRGVASLEELGVEKALAKDLTEAIKSRIKPPEVHVEGDLSISSYAPDGVDVVRQSLAEAEKVQENPLTIKYKGGGVYHFKVQSDDYKKAERTLKKAVDACVAYASKRKAVTQWVRVEEA